MPSARSRFRRWRSPAARCDAQGGSSSREEPPRSTAAESSRMGDAGRDDRIVRRPATPSLAVFAPPWCRARLAPMRRTALAVPAPPPPLRRCSLIVWVDHQGLAVMRRFLVLASLCLAVSFARAEDAAPLSERSAAAFEPRTRDSIRDGFWAINDELTYRGTFVEGLLLNVR